MPYHYSPAEKLVIAYLESWNFTQETDDLFIKGDFSIVFKLFTGVRMEIFLYKFKKQLETIKTIDRFLTVAKQYNLEKA